MDEMNLGFRVQWCKNENERNKNHSEDKTKMDVYFSVLNEELE